MTQKVKPEHSTAYSIPAIKKIRHEGRSTTIFWEDGTKTTVRAMRDEYCDPYNGFIAAVAKKLFGSTSMSKRIHDRLDEEVLKAQQAEERRLKEEEAQRKREKMERAKAKYLYKKKLKEARIEEYIAELEKKNMQRK